MLRLAINCIYHLQTKRFWKTLDDSPIALTDHEPKVLSISMASLRPGGYLGCRLPRRWWWRLGAVPVRPSETFPLGTLELDLMIASFSPRC